MFLVSILLFSCVKEENIEKINYEKIESVEVLRGNFSGLIKDENSNPVSGAIIRIQTIKGKLSTITDNDGIYYFNNILIDKTVLIQVKVDGYFDASRRISTIANSDNYCVVQLKRKIEVEKIEASNGGLAVIAGGNSIEIPKDAVVSEDGSKYLGTIHVFMNRIDPSDNSVFEQMPGELSGYDENGNLTALASYGMLMIAMESDDGKKLQLAEGKEAKLHFELPESFVGNAPETIPMWYFDENIGYWIEEGSAKKEGNAYIGKIKRFGTWNCDVKSENTINISGEITCTNGNELLPFLSAFIYSDGIPLAGRNLNKTGKFKFLNFFANKPFTIKLLNQCDEVVWEKQYEAYNSDTQLQDIIIPICGEQIMVSGDAFDCEGKPVLKGYVSIYSESRRVSYKADLDNGHFEIPAWVCNLKPLKLIVVDIRHEKSSETFDVFTNSGDVNLGNINVCKELENYCIVYPFADTIKDTIVLLDLVLYKDNGLYFRRWYIGDTTFVQLAFNEDIPLKIGNNYATSFVLIFDVLDLYGLCSYNQTDIDLDEFIVTLTELGLNSGDIIKGTFSGQVKTGWRSSVIKNITGKFKVELE